MLPLFASESKYALQCITAMYTIVETTISWKWCRAMLALLS